MTPERWREVTQIYGAVLSRAPEGRAAAVEELCGTDQELRREIESLLESQGSASLLDRPATDHGSVMQMVVPIGSQIGVFRIESLLGVGGMGEVYRARDTKLNRDVAIKILPPAFASDPDRLGRFKREAQVLASLNHPNIAAIYGFEDSGSVHALVLELVEGDTLADLLARPKGRALPKSSVGDGLQAVPHALPVEDALAVARQIADALEAAHEQGIIHRDLKPANIKVRQDGTVKVLDFGLAKIAEGGGAGGAGKAGRAGEDFTQSPTITTPAMTAAGMILGTAAYMSPEQAKGKPADKRSDIWAFGCVLYEMLTGKRAFEGEDVGDTLAAILRSEPDWAALPASTSPSVHRLLRRALQKERSRRLADIADARFEIDEPHHAGVAPVTDRRGRRERLAWSLAAIAAVAATLSVVIGYLHRVPADSRVLRSSIIPPADLTGDPAGRLAISPDGRRVAFLANGANGRRTLWVRPLDGLTAQSLAGTEDAVHIFWAADSRFLAFSEGGRLKKIDASSGPVLTLCSMDGNGSGPGTWSHDGVILFTPANDRRIFRVAAAGGDPVPVTRLADGETSHQYPYFLPDGRHFLFVAYRAQTPVAVFVASLDSPDRAQVLTGGSNVAYSQGFLLFLRESTLMAQGLDTRSFTLSGEAVPIVEEVFTQPFHAGAFSVSTMGDLVYQSGLRGGQLEWVARSGQSLNELGIRGPYQDVELAPDEAHATVSVEPAGGGSDILLIDLVRNVAVPFTFTPSSDSGAIWSPDSSRLVFRSNRRGHFDIYQKLANGSRDEEVLLVDDLDKAPTSWSPDGRFIMYSVTKAETSSDLWVLPTTGDRKPVPFLQTRFSESQGQFSPDGQSVAYTSNATGETQVFVAPFPGPGGQRLISIAGGQRPRWSRDGATIFYQSPTGMLMAVPVRRSADALDLAQPKPLFALGTVGGRGPYDVARDGRFLVNRIPRDSGVIPITLVTNWTAAVSR